LPTIPSSPPSSPFTPPSGDKTLLGVRGGGDHTLFLLERQGKAGRGGGREEKRDHQLWAAGHGQWGQLGTGNRIHAGGPLPVRDGGEEGREGEREGMGRRRIVEVKAFLVMRKVFLVMGNVLLVMFEVSLDSFPVFSCFVTPSP